MSFENISTSIILQRKDFFSQPSLSLFFEFWHNRVKDIFQDAPHSSLTMEGDTLENITVEILDHLRKYMSVVRSICQRLEFQQQGLELEWSLLGEIYFWNFRKKRLFQDYKKVLFSIYKARTFLESDLRKARAVEKCLQNFRFRRASLFLQEILRRLKIGMNLFPGLYNEICLNSRMRKETIEQYIEKLKIL